MRGHHIDGKRRAAYLEPAMAILPIITAPDPRLKIRAQPVPAVDDKIRRLMDDLLETMYSAIGVGLAAPQAGVASRVLVVDVARDGEKPQPLKLANPEILWRSPETMICNEGCLSLPEHYAEVTRPGRIRVRYLDYQNGFREMEAEGLLSTCLQHEIDHLDGILFVDHISSLKRGMILRKLAKAKRSKEPARAA
jgi:peptide deformylase